MLGPAGARTGRSLQLRTRFWLSFAIVIANVVGAVIVFVFANFVVPTPDLPNETEVRLVNLIGFSAYVAGALIVGNLWGYKRMRALREFLTEERQPTADERRQILTGPLRLAVVNGVPVYDASELGLLQAGFNRMVEGLRAGG